MAFDAWLAFAAFWLTFAIIPGPSALFCVSKAFSVGCPRAYYAPGGIAIGSIIHASLAAIGVGAILTASAAVFEILKWAGVAYLIYLGIRQWRTPLTFSDDAPTRPMTGWRVMAEGLLTMMTNPKSIFAYAAVLPLFIDPTRALSPQLTILAATTATITLIVNAGYVLLAAPLRRFLSSRRRERMVKRGLGSLFIAGALGLAMAERR